MTEAHDNTPADLIRQALVDNATFTLPSAASAWPLYVDQFPDLPGQVDDHQINAACVYDTGGTSDGRLMGTGQHIQHPGWQLRVRGRVHRDVYNKIKRAKEYLETVRRLTVEMPPFLYTIEAISLRGNILSLGRELGAKGRVEFTINGTITFTPIATTTSAATTTPAP